MPHFSGSQDADGAVAGPKPIRRLGHNEAYQLAMYVLDQYRGTSVSCRYVIPPALRDQSRRPQLIELVQKAVSRCVLGQPVLQVGISDAETSHPIFVHLDSLDLSQHIEWKFLASSVDFEATLCQLTISQLDATFPPMDKQPGWRMVILHQHEADFLEILFTWNHPHADGMSGKIFHQDLIRNLNAEGLEDHQESSEANILRLPGETTRLPPPIEHIMDLPLDMAYLVKTLWEDSKPRILCRTPTLAHWAPIIPLPYKTQFRSFTIENDILSRVLSACGRHQTTLTGVLHGLTLASLASHREKVAASGFQAATTIDMRRFVPSSPTGYEWLKPDRTMGNFVTQIHHTFDPDLVAKIRSRQSSISKDEQVLELDNKTADLIWDTATRIRAEIQNKLNIGVKNDVVGALKFVKDWNAQMKNAARRPRQASWMVTGLGVIDGDMASGHDPVQANNSLWKIRRAQFALSAEVTAAALMISPMTAAGERLCVGGSWQECAVDATLGECVMADLERWLGHIADF
ncbi:alcohol acetyltransferase [Xylaria cf. heliscus]|nr:alcohol acetyltransferase [Xylaria cf. heliscus]